MKPNPNSYRSLETEVVQWAEARKIIPNSTPAAQAVKTSEEAAELLEAATALKVLSDMLEMFPHLEKLAPFHEYRGVWLKKYKDAAGDIVVTLINGCALADVDLISDCLAAAYDEIKDRKGTLLPNGIFVKEAA